MIETYKTNDIILASTLKLKGYPIVDIQRHGNIGTFVFHDVEDKHIKEFDLGQSLVEPLQFNNTIKSLTTAVRRLVND